MKKLIIITSSLFVAALSFYFLTKPISQKVTMLLINAKVYTFDKNNTVAEAVAIRKNRIVDVGSTKDITSLYSSDNVVDLHGNTVLPGLIDGHAHILGEGGRLQTLDLIGTTSPKQVAEMVAQKVSLLKEGEWIIGRGWDQNDWKVKEFPHHNILDNVAPKNPVLLRRVDGHAVWVNTKTIELAGVTKETKDPEGGKIYREKDGSPSGIFVDNAIELANRIVPELTDEEHEQRIKLSLEECARLGLTEVHDMGVDMKTIRIYKKLIDEGNCPIRIYAVIDYPSETWNQYLHTGPEVGYGDGLLTIRAVKLYMDGALGSRGAAMVEAYSDDPGNRGLTIMSESQMDSVCRDALSRGFQVCTHAIGDRANNLVINAYEKIFNSTNKPASSLRWRVEHAQVLLESDIPRFQKLGILPSMQPTHATSDMPWAEARLGSERVKCAYVWRSVLNTGAHIIGGSDFPVEFVNPLFGIYAAFTRQDKEGNPANGWYKEQRMTREEAVRSFTRWAAYGSFEENDKGSIEKGKWADFTIISEDIMKVPPKEILNSKILMTIVNGKIVHR